MTTNTTTTKLTKTMKYDMLLAIEEVNSNPILVEFINHEKELIAKKNTTDRKPTKVQVANVELAKNILEVMNCGQIYTVSEILKNLNDSALTQSKISAVIRPMLTVTKDGTVNPNGVIERFEEKGKAYFRKLDLAEEAED
jgi:hypothetical protein